MKKVVHAFHTLKTFSSVQKAIIASAFSLQLMLVATSRPSQDDYGYLASLGDSTPIDVTVNFWHMWGGNLSSIFISSLFSELAVLSNLSVAFVCLGLITTYLIALATNAGLRLFLQGVHEPERFYISITVSCLGLASLAYPAHLASVAFTTATIAHLWPILLFFIVLQRAYQEKSSYVELLLSGFLLANANIAEGAGLLFFSILILAAKQWTPQILDDYLIPVSQKILVLVIGMILGLVLIVVSPGFISRIGVVDQISITNRSIPHSLLAALLDFSAAVVASPIFLSVSILLLYLTLRKRISLKRILFEVPLELVLVFSIYIALIGGATFAYAAWHQSLGLIYCVQFLGISLYLRAKGLWREHFITTIEHTLIVLLLILLSFDAFGSYHRQQTWDRAFQMNKCLVKLHSQHQLVGAELLNPVTKLGFEDIETWDWIRNDYVRWINTLTLDMSCNSTLNSNR